MMMFSRCRWYMFLYFFFREYLMFIESGFSTHTRMDVGVTSIYFSRFTLTMVGEIIALSCLLLSESQTKTNGDENTHTHACKYNSIFYMFLTCSTEFEWHGIELTSLIVIIEIIWIMHTPYCLCTYNFFKIWKVWCNVGCTN
jgi:hypothetical protein